MGKLLALLLGSCIFGSSYATVISPSGSEPVSRSVKPKHGAVTSESAVCSGVGGDILKQGGTAADAMIATVLCVGVVDGHHSGIGSCLTFSQDCRHIVCG